MTTKNQHTEKNGTIVKFYIGCGGRLNCGGHLTCLGLEDITDGWDWNQHCYIHDEDDEGNPIPESERKVTDQNGNILMDAQEYKVALETGIGRLVFNTIYDTTYTCYAEDMNKYELLAFLKYRGGSYCLNDILEEIGYSCEEIEVYDFFNCWEKAISAVTEDFLHENFHCADKMPEGERAYKSNSGKYYWGY